jgi:cysteine desulfuration protein SufE
VACGLTANQVESAAAELIEDFGALPERNRLDFLLELADALPPLPDRYANHPDLLEKVEECQSPVYLFVEVTPERKAKIFLTAPAEAPTTRGFASILHRILDGKGVDEVLSLSEDFVTRLGLTDLVSLLRLRGMQGMLRRIKRQVAEKSV